MVSKVAMRILKKYLEGGKRTTDEIYMFLNDRIKMGITRNELASLLKRIGINSNDEWKNKNEDENDGEQKNS
jgi:hypothetical protein|tara:strand:+ start:6241 stop:6456 length:216 start_codon:yes stop_codon:yes gene_type:complete